MSRFELINVKGVVDSGNSSIVPLTGGATFTGDAFETLNYGIVFVSVYADVASATDGLHVQQSIDGVNWDFEDHFTIAAGANENYGINPHARYLRIVYTNGGSAQTTFRLQVIAKGNSKPSSHRLQDTVTTQDDAELVKSVLAYRKSPDEEYFDVDVQSPLPSDGDSVYAKDVWSDESDLGDFSGTPSDLFNNLHSIISDTTANNPKEMLLHFNRTIVSNVVGLGAYSGDFSNVRIYIVNSGSVSTLVYDNSADATKRTSQTIQLPVTAGFNAIRIQFHTADTVTISNIVILKTSSVVARLQATKPDNTVTDINATNGGNLKVSLEEIESGISSNSNSQLNVTPYLSNGNEGIAAADSASIDAFGRWRVSNIQTIFDSKQTGVGCQLYWDDQEVSGGGTGSSYSENEAATTLSVSNTTAGKRVRQSKLRFNYQPGKSQLILITFNMLGGATGIIKQVGYFDDQNGIFLQNDEGTVNLVRRTYVSGSPVDNAVAQASWNIDTFDGNGPSGITLDFTKVLIFLVDFEWLGVGRIRLGFVCQGNIYYAHEMNAANTLTTVYMSKPNLPIRYTIENDGTGAADEIDSICCSVNSEGGVAKLGATHAKSNGPSGLVITSSGSYAGIGIRLKSTELDANVLVETISIISRTINDSFRWELVLNPTVAGTFTYSSVDAYSAVEAAIGASTNTVTGGIILTGGVGKDNANVEVSLDLPYSLGSNIAGTPDELVLLIYNYTASVTIDAVMGWRELL